MKKLLLAAVVIVLAATPAFAQAPKAEIKPEDTISSLLARQVGQKVELHLKSGEKFSGKLESANAGTAHLSGLAGQEFFDALISTPDIVAVLVRTH